MCSTSVWLATPVLIYNHITKHSGLQSFFVITDNATTNKIYKTFFRNIPVPGVAFQSTRNAFLQHYWEAKRLPK